MPNKSVQYPVMESFYTLQGEGRHTGRAAFFIRLGGCDVGCVWCDVKESWNAEKHPSVSVEMLASLAAEQPGRLAVITGGEPAMYQLEPLTTALQNLGFETNVETSGAYPLSGSWNWVCVSPKKFKAPLPEVLDQANEFKVVVYHPSDLPWMEQFLPHLSMDCLLYLQPEWSRSDQVLPLLIDYVKQHPRWRISLQTHKYLDIP